MPIPIQSGSITERMRKFFRIRGKVGFALDEIVAPVALVQDLTKGPYQSGVTPCAGSIQWTPSVVGIVPIVILLNDKAGSITPRLDDQFKDRSFSVSFAEFQNIDIDALSLTNVRIGLTKRATVVAAGVPTQSQQLISIQDNDGDLSVPVEFFAFAGPINLQNAVIYQTVIGDNVNVVGSRRTLDPDPSITIGPNDAIVIDLTIVTGGNAFVNVRGFYQQQPA